MGVIALTSIDPLVFETNAWLAAAAPGVDPVVSMLGLVVLLTASLVFASIALKAQAQRVTSRSTRPAQSGSRAASSAGA